MKLLIAMAGLLMTAQSYAAPLQVGDAAPCVVLNHIYPDGEKTQCIREPEQEGQLVLLEFFSAFCSDCKKNLPIVSNLHQELKDSLTVRLVGIDRGENTLRRYVNDNGELINFSVALDTARDAKAAYGVVATPTLFILNGENTVIYQHTGVLQPADVQEIKNIVAGQN